MLDIIDFISDVIPAKAGIQLFYYKITINTVLIIKYYFLDSRFRGNDIRNFLIFSNHATMPPYCENGISRGFL
ncbi:MAG: hypothetical protein LN573_02200 [Rickettsia endosymbiont of Oxypoda opaca]|nr:hypothetical protein [Rickettsia endosymbiont of Oxypoda opaca]